MNTYTRMNNIGIHACLDVFVCIQKTCSWHGVLSVCACVCVCAYVYAYISIYIYIYIHICTQYIHIFIYV